MMMYELMAFMAAAPETGDRFQAGKLMLVGAAALGIAIVAGVAARLKGGKDDDDGEE